MVSLSFAITGLQREVSSTYLKLSGNSIEVVGFRRGRAGQGLSSAHEFRGIPRHSEAPRRNRRFCWPGPRKLSKGIRNASAGEGKGERQGEKFRGLQGKFLRASETEFRGIPRHQTAPQGQIGLEFSKYMKSGCRGSRCTSSSQKACKTLKCSNVWSPGLNCGFTITPGLKTASEETNTPVAQRRSTALRSNRRHSKRCRSSGRMQLAPPKNPKDSDQPTSPLQNRRK